MYSYEDRLRAVRLFIKLGERAGSTIRQLGYPCRSLLAGWVRDACPEVTAEIAMRPAFSLKMPITSTGRRLMT